MFCQFKSCLPLSQISQVSPQRGKHNKKFIEQSIRKYTCVYASKYVNFSSAKIRAYSAHRIFYFIFNRC